MLIAETSTFSTASTVPVSSGTAGGWQRQAKLWSSLQEVCGLLGIHEKVGNDDLQFQHMQFKAGQRLHTIGQPFDMLFVVNSGFLKSVMIDESGNEQVLAFPMKGDLIGIDGIHSKHYNTETVALTTCEVIMIPFKLLSSLGRTNPEVEAAFFGVMSRELIREQGMISAIGALSAEARVARFLASMSDRFSALGYSGTQFNLRMTRQEIGSYLGLTLETVSRTLSAFHAAGLISVEQRSIEIRDIKSLRTLRRLPPSRSKQAAPKAAAANGTLEVAA
ncbi:helix-turn-helix domain-containing protein [Noviherbaspirillum sp. CPCC 100848]|uniref:Helix-turn-helix domain-containing protein n=1 Tax=Noviherbaspirillum album TaxID=3080276 RepID=A0ABU6J327_9BURK|nr:helix-turn-helix domain-containing protein [Noviherbaspirillum sp. CPCC 100848]MEC4717831.1 helix-turn-helix domain-containing protein [Noviherbaspirillum sp. CPCC 100848]